MMFGRLGVLNAVSTYEIFFFLNILFIYLFIYLFIGRTLQLAGS